MNRSLVVATVLTALLTVAASAVRAQTPTYGPELQGFDYPWAVHDFAFESQGEPLVMRYMDVQPAQPNGQTAVVLHGKNFCAATWEETIRALTAAGYRVIAPDQIGWCKSTKPARYQYSFQQLAANTHALVASLGLSKVAVIGHSTGGMLAARFALMYPGMTSALVLVDPIGLEDWKALGVPYRTVDEQIAREKATTAERIRSYERSTYYAGQWRPEYERWVTMFAGIMQGPGRDIVARNMGLIDDMIYTQPVVYEFPLIRVPTLIMIGDKDTTAIGKDYAPPEVREKLGRYPELAQRTKAAIPGSTLIEFPDAGHAPQIQEPDRFNRALIEGLAALRR
ncbi:MAG TPA: alpha/beta hydrolase [Roseiarcus sp.]|jgi:pimeloyl-ACP methyl ester carboxylesterase